MLPVHSQCKWLHVSQELLTGSVAPEIADAGDLTDVKPDKIASMDLTAREAGSLRPKCLARRCLHGNRIVKTSL